MLVAFGKGFDGSPLPSNSVCRIRYSDIRLARCLERLRLGIDKKSSYFVVDNKRINESVAISTACAL
jgi:hypothetical protein